MVFTCCEGSLVSRILMNHDFNYEHKLKKACADLEERECITRKKKEEKKEIEKGMKSYKKLNKKSKKLRAEDLNLPEREGKIE